MRSAGRLKRQFERHLNEALSLLRAFRSDDAEATDRVHKAAQADDHVGKYLAPDSVGRPDLGGSLRGAQRVIAYEHGKSSWEALYFEAANPVP